MQLSNGEELSLSLSLCFFSFLFTGLFTLQKRSNKRNSRNFTFLLISVRCTYASHSDKNVIGNQVSKQTEIKTILFGVNGEPKDKTMASSGEQPSYSSDYFSDSENENGSLSDLNDSYVSPNVTIILQGSLHYTVLEIVTLSIIMTAMIIVIVIGNMLVVIAISTENNLKSIQNWFIASLAIADMLLGLLVMPFSLAYELMAYWMFGEIW